MISLHYQKISGAGNTFIVAEGRNLPDGIGLSGLAQELCRPEHPHGGADGMILVDKSPEGDFAMHYYNPDGSTGMMCGNGGRCAVRFAADHGYIADQRALSFTNAGILYRALMDGENVCIDFPDPKEIRPNLKLNLLGEEREVHFVDVGTPHLLLFVDQLGLGRLADLDINLWGPLLRNHSAVQPNGANANFIEIISLEEGIRLRTFERGVEGETGACGTGAIASGILSGLLYNLPSPVQVIPTSGSPLYIHFNRIDAGRVGGVKLQGGTEILMEGDLLIPESLIPAL
ncbi:MAG: diaminopimelate epimerase [Candidatus Kapaibacterium sp.]